MEMEAEEPSQLWSGEGGEATTGQFVADVVGAEEMVAAAADEVDDDEEEDEVGEEEEEGEEEEYEGLELPTEEDDALRYDSDDGSGSDEDEEDLLRRRKASDGGESSRTNIALVPAPPGLAAPEDAVAPPLAPPRFAAAGYTAGFMRIAAAEATGSQEEEEGGREIVVLYRYTRFSRTSSRAPGVQACRRTKFHWLRFAVPPDGDMASSLAWAGASLSPLVYPALFRRELQDLWSTMLAAPAPAAIATAKRLQVVVDAGILRREDYTAERMAHMRGALEDIVGEPWPDDYYHVGVELRLPEPVVQREEDGGGSGDEDDGAGDPPPAKRRRVVAEDEECCVCLDPLERDLAAWPGCRHVFHGECVEKTLAGSEACPLCRRKLSDALAC